MNHKKLEERIDKLEDIVLENICKQRGGCFDSYSNGKKECRKDQKIYTWDGSDFVYESLETLRLKP